jgi:hypothetical protein
MQDIFATATRKRLRFSSPMGPLSVEDLWELPLTSTKANQANLDDIAIAINKKLKESSTESFVRTTVRSNTELQLQMDIVKQIISERIAMDEAAAKRRDKAEMRQKLTAMLAEKEMDELNSKSRDEILKMLEDLEKE